MFSQLKPVEVCDFCNAALEESQIGLCDDCQGNDDAADAEVPSAARAVAR